eukprot:scaffold1772_cov93-Skeletonema_dohrnii-CCMP3373.AAC.5
MKIKFVIKQTWQYMDDTFFWSPTQCTSFSILNSILTAEPSAAPARPSQLLVPVIIFLFSSLFQEQLLHFRAKLRSCPSSNARNPLQVASRSAAALPS